MNAAGNADGGRGSGTGVYIQVVLTLSTWLISFAVILASGALSNYAVPSYRGIYDALSLSALVVFIVTVLVNSLTRSRATAAAIVSSALLTATYYSRLVQILLTKGGSIVVLPLLIITRFEGMGTGSVSLDLGQVGILTMLYFLAKSPSLGAVTRRLSKRWARSPFQHPREP